MSGFLIRTVGAWLIAMMAAGAATAEDRNPIDPPLTADECVIVGKRKATYELVFWAGKEATAVFDGKVVYNNVGDKVTSLEPMRIKLPKNAGRGYHMLVIFISGEAEGRSNEWAIHEQVVTSDSVSINPVCGGSEREAGADVRYVGVVRFVPK